MDGETTGDVILPTEKSFVLDEGKYNGVIISVKERIYVKSETQKYKYIDLIIKEDESEREVYYSAPANITETTKLGKLLSQFTGLKAVGMDNNITQILINKKISFMIVHEVRGGNTYNKVVDESIHPIEVSVDND